MNQIKVGMIVVVNLSTRMSVEKLPLEHKVLYDTKYKN